MSRSPASSVRGRSRARRSDRVPETDVASFRERGLAYLIDAVVFLGVSLLVARIRRRTAAGRLWLAGLVALVGGFAYHVVLEGTWGRTVGKGSLGIAVVDEDGGPCTYRAAFVRTALRVVDWLPAGYLLGVVSIALTGHRQRLGDLAAGTLVVRVGRGRERSED